MPDDYYVSQYSGEEIDERLTAAHNAVRYDAAQSLADAQKKQARANIAAAPDGYGLGTGAVAIDDYNNAVTNGWYRGGNNYPSKISYANYGMVRVDNNGKTKLQTFYAGDTGNAMISPFMAIRKSIDYGATWSEWEYVNPPMVIGVEYRTTERFLGKPVYVKVVNLGAGPSANTQKDVAHGISNMGHIVDYAAELTMNGAQALTIPYHMSDENKGWAYVNHDNFSMVAGGTALTGYNNCYGWVKYTKTTD